MSEDRNLPAPIEFPKAEQKKTPKKKSLRQQLKESEQRNMAAIQYIQVLEKVCKDVLVYSAECHEKLEIIVVPGMEFALKTLEQICIHVAPVCGDVEDIKLPAFAVAQLAAEGGALVEVPEEEPDVTSD